MILHGGLGRGERPALQPVSGEIIPVFEAGPVLSAQVLETMHDPEALLKRYETLPGRCGLRAARQVGAGRARQHTAPTSPEGVERARFGLLGRAIVLYQGGDFQRCPQIGSSTERTLSNEMKKKGTLRKHTRKGTGLPPQCDSKPNGPAKKLDEHRQAIHYL